MEYLVYTSRTRQMSKLLVVKRNDRTLAVVFHDSQQGRVQWWRPVHSEMEWVASRSECLAHTSQDARKLILILHTLKKQWTSNLSVFWLVPWCTQITCKKIIKIFHVHQQPRMGKHMVLHYHHGDSIEYFPYKINAMCIEHTTVLWANGTHKCKGVLCYSSVKYTHVLLFPWRWTLFW